MKSFYFFYFSSAKKDTSIKLNRKSYQNLYDVTIMCANNRNIQAHKCVLVSRMEYFHWMFKNNWSEVRRIDTKYFNRYRKHLTFSHFQRSIVSLTSVPIEYMEPIIDFLYTNDVPSIKSQSQNCSDNYLYNMIIICDQYFINQLRNIFETMLIDRLTVRKCADMLVFAHAYNCKLLKKCSMEFIIQNMARVLEQRSLEDLDFHLLKEIGQLYRKEFRIKESVSESHLRFEDDGDLGDVLLESFVEDFKVDLGYKCELRSGSQTKVNKKVKDNAQERRNYEKEAKGAIKNLSIESSDERKKVTPTTSSFSAEAAKISDELVSKAAYWTKVSEKKNAKKKGLVASARLNEILQNEEKEKEDFVTLTRTSKTPTSPIDIPTTVPASPDSDDSNTYSRTNLSLGNFTPTKRMTQKQRKSFPLLSTSIDETTPMAIPTPTPEINSSIENAWGGSPISIPKTSPSLTQSFFNTSPTPSTSFHRNKFSKSKSSSCEADSFTKILQEERKEREYYVKLKSKSLVLTQMEETAIDELKAFYNVDNVYDEFIRVERTSHIKPTMNFAVWHQ